jgi:hypothetical protein
MRMKVSAVIPTRGDVDLSPILETLDWCDDVVVWNNAKQDDLGIYGRYAAINHAEHQIVVTQDDDVLVTCWEDILAAYQPGVLTVNYPEPWDIPWVARGAIFDRDLPEKAFQRYDEAFARDHYFTHYACDGVFALLTETKVIDFGSEDLPHGLDVGRISTSPGWYDEKRPLIQERCKVLA